MVTNSKSSDTGVDKETQEQVKQHVDRMIKIIDKHIPFKENGVLILLKSHLLVEYFINQLIILFSKPSEGYKKCGEEFFEKIQYIGSIKEIGFTEDEIESIKKLNKIRNKLSHELEYKISESDVDSIGFCFGKDYIICKSEKGDDLKALLIWVVNRIIAIIYTEISYCIIMEKRKVKK